MNVHICWMALKSVSFRFSSIFCKPTSYLSCTVIMCFDGVSVKKFVWFCAIIFARYPTKYEKSEARLFGTFSLFHSRIDKNAIKVRKKCLHVYEGTLTNTQTGPQSWILAILMLKLHHVPEDQLKRPNNTSDGLEA